MTRTPLGSRKTWSCAVCLATGAVVASATLAQQNLNAEAAYVDAPEAVQPAAAPAIEPAPPSAPVATTYPPEPPPPAAPRETVVPPEPRRRFLTIAAPSNGSVAVVYVRVGDRVDAGQALLTFNDRQAATATSQLRLEIASARARTAELERTIKALDLEIAAATANLPAPVLPDAPPEAAAIVARAQAIYNEAIARERRAAALQAHGIAATQELEAAQMAVRGAAEDLALARREADAKRAMAATQVGDARARAEAAIADQRGQRQQLLAEAEATRQMQREAEASLAEASADSARLVVRAPAAAVVTGLAVQPGDRTLAGSRLLELEQVPPQ